MTNEQPAVRMDPEAMKRLGESVARTFKDVEAAMLRSAAEAGKQLAAFVERSQRR